MPQIYDNSGLGPTPGQWEFGGIGAGGRNSGRVSLDTNVKKVTSWNAGGITILPPGGCNSFVWVQFNQSDGSYQDSNSGIRQMARRGVTFPNYSPGYEQAVVIAACNIGGLQGSMWVAPFEYHHTGTNLTTTPTHIMMNSGGLAIDSFYGPQSAGQIGGGGSKSTLFNLSFNGGKYATQNKWHVFVHHMRFSSSGTGVANVYHGVQGTDSAVVSLTGLRNNVSNIFTNTQMYELVGLYASGGHAHLLIGGWKAFSTVAEAIAEAAVQLGGDPGTPPPPPPPPDPTNDVEPTDWMGGRYAITGTSTLGSVADKQRCSRIVLSHTGSLTGMGAYIAPVTGTAAVETFRFALWPDNGAGTDPGPGAPLGITPEVTIDAADPPQRYTADFLVPTSGTQGQVVWAGMHMGGDANEAIIRYQSVPQSFRLMDAPYANGTVAWDATQDAVFDIEMVTWVRGVQTSGSVPQALSAPIITGSPVVGQTLTLTSVGQWSAPTGGAVLQWARSLQSDGGGYSTISNAHAQTYVVQPEDVGYHIRNFVSVTNAIGTGTAGSNQLGPVTSQSVPAGSTGRTVLAGHSLTATRSTTSTRRAYEGGGG